MKFYLTKSIYLIIFFISMAMLESAVVIYLRELYYPSGFVFPLVGMNPTIICTELARELATIIMLWTIAFIAGRNFPTRFAWFIIGFGIWDIFYYVFLYVFIQWPSTLFDWDILFLIPLPWYGPVIAPVLISIAMISFGAIILNKDFWNEPILWKPIPISFLILGCILGLYSFMGAFWASLDSHYTGSFSDYIIHKSQEFVPTHYNYTIFFVYMFLISIGIYSFFKANQNKL